jgi:hypothetical protein
MITKLRGRALVVVVVASLAACSGGGDSDTSRPKPSASSAGPTPTASESPGAQNTPSPEAGEKPGAGQKPNAGAKNVEVNAVDFGSTLVPTETFDGVAVGESREKSIDFKSVPASVVSSVEVSSLGGDFAKTADSCTGATITPTTICTVRVTYTRVSIAESTANLTVKGTFAETGESHERGIFFTAPLINAPVVEPPSSPLSPPAVESPAPPEEP